jgi:short-subunit dehydrogenase
MHVAITGASVGIGEALAREWAGAGAKLTLVARRRELLDRLAGELGGTQTFVAGADLADPARSLEWIAPAEAALGPIDVLVNNAGVQYVEPFDAVSPERGERLLALDLLTPLRLMHAVVPAMLARRGGHIVNIASMAAFGFLPGMVHYDAAKAGLAGASETLRSELRKSGVNVLTVYPGPVKTAMADAAYASYENNPTARLLPSGTAGVLARRVRRAVERRSARVVYPRFYYLQMWFPGLGRFLTDRLAPHPRRPPALPAESSASVGRADG